MRDERQARVTPEAVHRLGNGVQTGREVEYLVQVEAGEPAGVDGVAARFERFPHVLAADRGLLVDGKPRRRPLRPANFDFPVEDAAPEWER
jgi:hypothetical protein